MYRERDKARAVEAARDRVALEYGREAIKEAGVVASPRYDAHASTAWVVRVEGPAFVCFVEVRVRPNGDVVARKVTSTRFGLAASRELRPSPREACIR